MARNIRAVERPFVVVMEGAPQPFTMCSEEVQRLLDAYTVHDANHYAVKLSGYQGSLITIRPATLGGGWAFVW